MKLIDKSITRGKLSVMAKKTFVNMVKAVIDIEKKTMVVDGELHSDEEAFLLQHGSVQEDLWGINLYPEEKGEHFIEFDSMINVRPGQNNFSRDIEDIKIKQKIVDMVTKLVKK